MNFKFVHSADIHLDSPLRGLDRYEGAPVDRLRGATRRAFENLVQLCLDERAAFLLIAGDLYDGDWPDYNTGLFFLSQVKRLHKAGIGVYMVRGNHDAQSPLSKSLSLRNSEGIHDFASARAETKVLDELGVAIHGRGYPKWDTKDDLSLKYPQALSGYFNIGILHTCADGRAGHDDYAPCKIDGLVAKGYDYWALGHVHAREVIRTDPWIVFPGNLQGRHARENGPKGASLVSVEDGRVASVEHRALDEVRWVRCEVDASAAASADDVVDLVRAALEREVGDADGRIVAARVVVAGVTDAHVVLAHDAERYRNEIRARAAELDGVWVEKINLATRARIDLEALMDRDDPIGGLLRSFKALRCDDERLAAYTRHFKELFDKLPKEYRDSEDALRLTEGATVRDLIDEIEATLLPELLAGGHES
ncbi:MAG: exonuclease SbcCD subunit D [Polyangiales bacterium]